MLVLALLQERLAGLHGRLFGRPLPSAPPASPAGGPPLALRMTLRRRAQRDRRALLAMDERWLEDIGLTRGEVLRPQTHR